MRLQFLEWAFNSHGNTVDVVIELSIIIEWTGINVASEHKIEVLPNDALAMLINKQDGAIC